MSLAPAFAPATRLTWVPAPSGGWRSGSTDTRPIADPRATVRVDGLWWPAGGESTRRVALPTCGHVDPSSTDAAVWMAETVCAVCIVKRDGIELPAASLDPGQDAVVANCHGSNHRHYLPVGLCTGCGADVALTARGTLVAVMRRESGARQAVCWSGHVCDPYRRASWALIRRERGARGVVSKGSTVRVVKGRNLAKGTVGVVRWTGVDSYTPGALRLGLAVDGQTRLVYVTSSNVEVVAG